MCPSLRAGEQTAEYGMETSTIALQGKVQNPTIHRESDAYSVLGLTRPSTGTLSGEGHNTKQCAVQWDAYWQVEACNSKQTQRTIVKMCWVVALGLHTAAHTAETFRKLKFEVMAHPPYSPDLAPSDYHLFSPLKEALGVRRFTSDQDVKDAVHVAHCSAEILRFGGHQEACATMDQMRWKARGLCWIIMLI